MNDFSAASQFRELSAASQSQLILPDGELHVWEASLDAAEDELARLASFLSPDERSRAACFHFERDRRRFMAGRGILRSILASYLGCLAVELSFTYGVHGKPALASGDLQFNLAHSDELAVIGVTRSGQVGIDVERVRPSEEFMRLADDFFSPGERMAISALPPEEQLTGFFTCWTRKEAYLKATGEGVTTALDSFDVSVAPNSIPQLLRRDSAPHDVQRWLFSDLPLLPGYLGAVAFEGPIEILRHGTWRGAEIEQ
jgi:4'-phosphopantetheinyl transferase